MKKQSDYTDKTYAIDLTDLVPIGINGDRIMDVETKNSGRGGFDGKSFWLTVRTNNK